MATTTVRCPECNRRNQVPAGAEAKARCGACRAPLRPGGSAGVAVTRSAPAGGGSGLAGGPGGPGGPGSPWGEGGPAAPASPFGPAGLGGGGGPWAGGGDPSGARMRQARRTGRTASTSGAGSGLADFAARSADPGDRRSALVRRWDELLRLAPPDMGLTAAMGDRASGPSSDPVSWLSSAAGIPRPALEAVRRVRNSVAANRPVPDAELASALGTLDRALAVVGRFRLPE